MGLGILGWQILILVTIVAAGRSRGIAVIFWVIWTAVQVFALPLSLLQFGTIWLGYLISRALFPDRASVASAKPVPPSPVPAPKLESNSKIVQTAAPMRQEPVNGVERQAVNIAKSRLLMKALLKELPSGTLDARDISPGMFQAAVQKARERKERQPSAVDAPSHGELSDSLVAYLESLDDTSKERGATASRRRLIHPDDVIFPSRASKASSETETRNLAARMCQACADESTRVVSGLRYCSDCGAFLGMQS